MFRVDLSENRLKQVEQTTFTQAGLREREHLQEWLAKSPEALSQSIGEELLVIQKEFDGFDGTRERLDLLMLDKSGQLVVVENKLDDSGRDVVWQALKYAAYCSSLKKTEIAEIYQQFLDRHDDGDAANKICEFLEIDDLDETVLNEGNDQRVVFIAANFRREVTSTVLWLREHQIDARCIKVAPYLFDGQLLVNLQQVIPPPEAADYMIRMAQKDTEEKSVKGAQRKSHEMRFSFWEELLDSFRSSGLERWQNISPSRDHWLTSRFGVSGCNLVLVFLKKEIRVELNLGRGLASENKWLFDRLIDQKSELDEPPGLELQWRRMDQKKVSIVQCKKSVEGYDKENWPEMIEWLKLRYQEMEGLFVERIAKLTNEMKSDP